MPIYEYACEACEHVFDALQKMDADPLTECPECGKPTLKKLLSAPNFRLKGGGWYETDFKKDKQRNLAGDAKITTDSGAGSQNKGDTKGDSKGSTNGKDQEASKPKESAGKSTPKAGSGKAD